MSLAAIGNCFDLVLVSSIDKNAVELRVPAIRTSWVGQVIAAVHNVQEGRTDCWLPSLQHAIAAGRLQSGCDGGPIACCSRFCSGSNVPVRVSLHAIDILAALRQLKKGRAEICVTIGARSTVAAESAAFGAVAS